MAPSFAERKKLLDGWDQTLVCMRRVCNVLQDKSETPIASHEYMLAYTIIYNLSTTADPQSQQSNCWELYQRYGLFLTHYMKSTTLPALLDKPAEFMLPDLLKQWNTHKVMVRWFSRIFGYIDRYYVPSQGIPSLAEVAQSCFREEVFKHIKDKAERIVISLIDRERDGEQIDGSMIRNAVQIFAELDNTDRKLCVEPFEKLMLEDTAEYYSRKAAGWLVEYPSPAYILLAESSLNREHFHVSRYLSSSSVPKLMATVEHEVLISLQSQILEKANSGFSSLLRENRIEDISRMYRFFSRVPQCLEPVVQGFKNYVAQDGLSLLKQAQHVVGSHGKSETKDKIGVQARKFVTKVIEMHNKYSWQYVEECFMGNSLFAKALKEAFEVFCNESIAGGTSIAELVATYCDSILKSGKSETLSKEEIEDLLEKVVKIVTYMNDKDLFAEFYRKKLARRLLLDRNSVDVDNHERSILTKMKHVFGSQFTSKMERMTTDLAMADEINWDFKEFLERRYLRNPGLDFSVSVLTAGCWPSYKPASLNLPKEMIKCKKHFGEFYGMRTKNRELTWVYTLGSCIVTGKFDKKPIELIIGTYQACALLLFNYSKKLSYSEIKSQLNLPDEDVVRVLHSLACAKYKILCKEPSSPTVAETDKFTFNAKFTDRAKIKIPLPPPTGEKKKVIQDVNQDRRLAIEAAIVRIMKSRKVLSSQKLISECIQQLQRMFKPDVKVIKKRIEELIEREFLKRDESNFNMFHYLA